MAVLTQTAANVGLSGSTATLAVVQAGEAVTQGMPVYRKSDTKYWKADSNQTSEVAAATGIVLTPAAADGYFVMVSAGTVDLGATLAVGETYVVAVGVGTIGPIGDLTTGDYVTILGVASAADALLLDIKASGQLKP